MFSDRILPVEVLLHERLVDDRNLRRGGVVEFGEVAADHERQLHRAEVSLRDRSAR